MGTLDYASFPHIFATVVEYCDRKTKNRLRLLSSATRRDVDRSDCGNISCFGSEEGPPLWGSVQLGGLTSPFLNKCNEELQFRRTVTENQIFVIENARSLTIPVEDLKEMCIDDTDSRQQANCSGSSEPRHLLHRLRPTSQLMVVHMAPATPPPPTVAFLSSSISLPAVYRLCIVYSAFSACACSPEIKLDHDSTRLCLINIEHVSKFCSLAVTALTPYVEKPTLLVKNHECVSAYIEDVKRRQLHPNLSVTVNYFDTATDGDEDRLQRRLENFRNLQHVWSRALGVPFEVNAKHRPKTAVRLT